MSYMYIKKRRIAGVLFFMPTLLHISIFLVIPICTALVLSFTKYTILSPPVFIGLNNFLKLFSNWNFWNSLRISLIYVIARVSGILCIGFFISFVLNKKFFGRGAFHIISFVPFVIPLVVTSVIWKAIYRPFGLMEQILGLVGFGAIPWLSSSEYALTAVTITTIWSGVGYYTVLILAGLQTISTDVLEAAVIDGAVAWRRFLYVILPLMKPTLFYVTVVAVVGTLQQFPPFLIMTGGGPGQATRVLSLMTYQYAFVYLRMGYASALSLIMFIIMIIFTLIQSRINRYKV